MAGSKMRFAVSGVAFGLAALVTSTALADPPGRVARLSFTAGAVAFRPASVDDWTNALINYPVTTGDHLWVDRGGRAELQIGTTAVRNVRPSASSAQAAVFAKVSLMMGE